MYVCVCNICMTVKKKEKEEWDKERNTKSTHEKKNE